MTQNIYDDPQFYDGYSQLRRSVEGLDGAPEWPALRALLPDLRGLNVMDLGCGYGWFCRWAQEQGAARVLGLDVSEKMLAQAKALTSVIGITYQRADLETFQLPAASFDVAYSSLVLHYILDVAAFFTRVRRALTPGGRLVLSTEHPIYMAPSQPVWSTGSDSRQTWPLNGYLAEGPRTTDWFTPGVVKHHRTLGTTLNSLIQGGFVITHVEEWGPTEQQIDANPQWAKERERPMFLLVAAQRP